MAAGDAMLDHAPFAIDEFEPGEAQKKARMVEFLAGRLGGDFAIFAQEGWQLELAQTTREQNLRYTDLNAQALGREISS
jgi:hypothetical protein